MPRPSGRRVGKTCRKPTRALRGKRACTRLVRVGAFTRKVRRTTTRYRFSGRLGAKALKPGTYQLRAVVTDAGGNASKPVSRTFKVKR